jgi:energy-coupling factor transporter ATP-binding protein EcfA2
MPEPASIPALDIRDLAKSFDRAAVDGLQLIVAAGEYYTLLGPNGAGKTTTLRMVAGLLRPDRGSISVFGVDSLANPIAAKQTTAWLSDEPMIYDKLTPDHLPVKPVGSLKMTIGIARWRRPLGPPSVAPQLKKELLILLTPFNRTVDPSDRVIRVSWPPLTSVACASASVTVSVVRCIRSPLGWLNPEMVSA